MNNKKHFGRHIKFVPGILAVFAIFAAITMWLWNALLPVILNLPTINFWQALGLLILTRLLFGGFKPHHNFGRRHHEHRHFQKKWMKMSPEERKAFVANRYFTEMDNDEPAKEN